jgi:threonine/homoserine/homoserine lactone efflux protein
MNTESLLQGVSPVEYDSLITFIIETINLAVGLSALVAVAFLVYAGFQYIISQGEGERAEKAQRSIIYVLIGLILVFISPLLIRFILTQVLGQ